MTVGIKTIVKDAHITRPRDTNKGPLAPSLKTLSRLDCSDADKENFLFRFSSNHVSSSLGLKQL